MGVSFDLEDLLDGPTDPVGSSAFQTPIPAQRQPEFDSWVQQNQISDLDHPDSHYDYRGAFMAGVQPDPSSGHWPDTFKQPGHPTFSTESQYAAGRTDAGTWDGDRFVPPNQNVAPPASEPRTFDLDELLNARTPPERQDNPADAYWQTALAPPPPVRRPTVNPSSLTGAALAEFAYGATPGAITKDQPEPVDVTPPSILNREVVPERPSIPVGMGVAMAPPAGPITGADVVAGAGALGAAAKEYGYMEAGGRLLQPIARLGAPAIESALGAIPGVRAVQATNLGSKAVGAVAGAAAEVPSAAAFGAGREIAEGTPPEQVPEKLPGYVAGGALLGALLGGYASKQLSASTAVAAPADVARLASIEREAANAQATGRATPEQETGFAYQVLGLQPDATQAEIETAFKQRAAQFHPQGKTPDENLFKTFSEAKAIATQDARARVAQSPSEAAPTAQPGVPTEPQTFELDDLLKPEGAGTGQSAGVTAPEAVTPPERTGHPEPPPGLRDYLQRISDEAVQRGEKPLSPENIEQIVTGQRPVRAEAAPEEGRRVATQGAPEGMPERRVGARRGEVQPPVAEAPAAVSPEAGFEDFAREYRQHFADMQKYGPDQVGSQVFAEKMATMAEAHPDWAERVENEGAPAPKPPVEAPPLAPEPTTLEQPILGPVTPETTDRVEAEKLINADRIREGRAAHAGGPDENPETEVFLPLSEQRRLGIHQPNATRAQIAVAEEMLRLGEKPEPPPVEQRTLAPESATLDQPKMAPKANTAEPYKVWTPKSGFTEMPDAKPAKLALPPGFEDMQFMVHKAVGQPGWSVTEASTGANVGLGKTRAAAIETATKALTTVGPESTRKAIEQTTAKIKAGEAARNGEPVPEPTPADPIEALRQHAQAIAVTEKAIEHGKGADGEPFTPEQIDGFKKDAADQRAQLEQKIEQHAEVNGLKEAEKLRGQIWNEIKNTEVETPKPPVASINPKFKKLDNDALVARQVELEDRIQKDQAILNKGVTPWVRDDPNMDITAPGTTKRTGTSWSRSAMYAKGRINQSGRLLDEVLAEVKDRKITPDEHAGMEDAAKERAAMAAEENAKADAAEFDEHETTGPEAGFVVPDMLKPTKIVAALYKRMNETEVSDAVKRIFAPASRSPEAAEGAQIVRQRMGEQAHDFEVAKMALGQARKDVPLLTTPQGLDFTDAIELGQQQATVKLTAAHQGIRAALDKARQDVQDLGTGKLEEFNENYLGHIWEKNQGTFAQIFGRRPLEGSKAFLKQRTIPTIREGIDQGLVPVVDNPVDMVLLKVREMNRYVMAHRILADFKEQGLAKFVKAGQQAPDGWARINDKIATVYAPRTEGGAMAIRGEYWSPEPVARILNNHLSPGLRGNPLYDAYMGLGNVMNQAQLGLSAFHLGFTSLDAAISRAALAVLHVSERDFPAAIRTALSVPAAPITNILKGNKVLQEYLRPGTQGAEVARVVDGLIKAGGRVKMDEMFKNNAVESFLKAVRRQPLQTAAKGVAGAVIGGALGGPVGAVAGAAFMTKAMGAALELAAKPLMEKIVPRQKLGVFFDLAQFELSRLPADATDAQVREVMALAWNSVDNRMGQVVYDNHFWNKALKDLAHASIRSVGWNWGTASELGGGVKDLSQGKMTPRASYTLALPVTVGLLGALTTYLYTGEGPQDLKDYFYPRTGRKNPEGDDERLALPSYMKDIFSYERHPVTTLGHKLHPLIGTASEMLNNQDFYGDQIRNPHDPVVVQAQDAAEYLAKQFIPFGVRGAMQGGQEGQSRATQAGSFVGVTPAPREVVRSPAENEVAQYLAEHRPAVRTREEAAKGKNRADLRRSLRTGDAGVDQIVEQIQSGALTRDQGRTLLRENEEDPSFTRFKMLPVDIAERVYRMGSEEERAVWRPAFAEKIRHAEDAAAQASALKAFDLPYKESYRAIGRMAR